MGKRRARNSYSSYRKLSSLSLSNKEWWISSYWSIIIIILINDHYNQILHRKAVGKRGSSSYSSYRKSSSLQNIVNIVVAIIIIIIITAVQDNYSFLHQEIRGETKHVESWWFERLLLVASTKSPTKWLNFQQKKLNFSWFGRALLVTRTRQQWLNFIFSFIRCSFSYGVMMFIFMTSFWVQFLKIPQ